MTDLDVAGRFRLGDRSVRRMGHAAMQLAGRTSSSRRGTAPPS